MEENLYRSWINRSDKSSVSLYVILFVAKRLCSVLKLCSGVLHSVHQLENLHYACFILYSLTITL